MGFPHFKRQKPEKILRHYHEIDKELEQRPVIKAVSAIPTKGHAMFVVYEEDDEGKTETSVDHEMKPQFFRPSLQVLRNQFVQETLTRFKKEIFKKFTKMAVMGCGELSLERFLIQNIHQLGISRVVSIDIDEESLTKGVRLMELLMFQHNSFRSHQAKPVLLEYYLGNILQYDSRLEGISCVVSTEVIEHISKKEAEIFVRTVLGKVRPRLFILSTPNHEFNEAFDMKPGEFRHDDHKYEFTREEFEASVERIVNDYPGYSFEIHYVGTMPGFERLGGATQFAVIWTEDVLSSDVPSAEPYTKVGYTVAQNGLSLAFRPVARSALQQWFQEHPLIQDTLIDTGDDDSKYWRIDLEDLKKLMCLPRTIELGLCDRDMMDSLELRTRGRLISKFRDDDDEDSSHFLLPEGTSIDGILALLS